MRLNAPSTPITGTIITSMLEKFKSELFGSLIEKFFLKIGNLYFTTLKLTPCINGTNRFPFFLNFGNIL